MSMTTKHFYKACTQIALATFLCGAVAVIPAKAQDAAPQPAPQAEAQPGGRADQMQARQLEMLTKKLNLTADQQAQVKSIQQDTRQQMMAVRNDSTLSQEQQQSKMMDIRKSSQDKIRGVLTDEQKPKFDAMQAQMRGRMRNRQQGQAPPQ
jgi:Spy/CpxP family protein refolding chaperone